MASSPSPQLLFSAAEQAFVGGRLVEARANLLQLEGTGLRHPAVHHLRAIVERGLGDLVASRRYFEAALQMTPGDPQIANNFGNLLRDVGDDAGALETYERALALQPAFPDALFNRALVLQRLGRIEAARAGFREIVQSAPGEARAWAALGVLEKDVRDLQAAAVAFDQALALQPDNRLAANGRARIAMERAEGDTLARYRRARELSPGDRQLIFEETEAKLVEGDSSALEAFAAVVADAPDWTFGQIALARMLREAGRTEAFDTHIEAALEGDPSRAELWIEYIGLLGSCGLDAEAAGVTRRARQALGNPDRLVLTEAVYAGRAGDLDHAAALLGALPRDFPGRTIHDCAHQIRSGDLGRALLSLDTLFAEDRWSVSTWAVAELLYRKTGDPRSEWLSGQDGLIRTFELPLDRAGFEAVDGLLWRLHQAGSEMVGQSVRAGTQTRWQLFDRLEPELGPLREALEDAVASYVAGLPAWNPEDHPLLRHRGERMRISGSWSIRLTGSGHHASHFHPEGLISSACYLRVPSEMNGREGWLELGRAPPDLLMDLEPLAAIAPAPCQLTLFPSYLYHGTCRFRAGERMSVAFDVTSRSTNGAR